MTNIFNSETLPLPYPSVTKGIFDFDEVSYKYQSINDSDIASPLVISSANIILEGINSVTINGTGLGLSNINGYYNNWTIRTGSVNYNITGYIYNSENNIEFTVTPSWSSTPLRNLELFKGDYTVNNASTILAFETPYISTVYLPNAEDNNGRFLIISYGKNRPIDSPLNISPGIGSNDSIDTLPVGSPVTLIYPNDKLSIVSSGVDNWIFQ